MSFRSIRALTVGAIAVLIVAGTLSVLVSRWPRTKPFAPDFTLTQSSGKSFRLSQLRGHAVALVFGYTHCPDVCPTTLAALARAKHQLGASGNALDVVFITVDPERDTPARMARYARLFDPSFIGLSGTAGQLEPIFAAYHIYHQALPAADAQGDYAVAHSSIVTLIGPAGRIRDVREWDDAPQHLAAALRLVIS